MDKLKKFGTFVDVSVDETHDAGYEVHHLLWAYRIKTDAEGDEEFRARVCFNGRKEEETCFGDVSSPVLKPISGKLIDITATHRGWKLHNADVDSAFVQVVNPRKVYCRYPKGMEIDGRCLRIHKKKHGERGAPLAWNQAFHDFLVSIGGKPSIHDECLYLFEVKKPKKNPTIQSQEGEVTQLNYENYGGAPERAYIGLHVDDAKFTGPDIFIEKFEESLSARFPTKLMGEEKKFVGVEQK